MAGYTVHFTGSEASGLLVREAMLKKMPGSKCSATCEKTATIGAIY